MRHIKAFKRLGRNVSQRKALYRSLLHAFFKYERIETTILKAKEIRRHVEKIITRARVNTLHNKRIILKWIKSRPLLIKLFEEIAPNYIGKPGGYTRIYKTRYRDGDASQMAILELIKPEQQQKTKKKTKSKKTSEKKSDKSEAVENVKNTSDIDDKTEIDKVEKDPIVNENTEISSTEINDTPTEVNGEKSLTDQNSDDQDNEKENTD